MTLKLGTTKWRGGWEESLYSKMPRLVEPNSQFKEDDLQNEMEIKRINWEFKELQQSFKYIKSRNNLENEVVNEAGNCKEDWYLGTKSSIKDVHREVFNRGIVF